MGFNMSLEFSLLDDDHFDDYAKITKVWEKSAGADPNHPQHYIEITFTPEQFLVGNEKPENYSVPVFFYVQCSLAAPTLVNGKFLNHHVKKIWSGGGHLQKISGGLRVNFPPFEMSCNLTSS